VSDVSLLVSISVQIQLLGYCIIYYNVSMSLNEAEVCITTLSSVLTDELYSLSLFTLWNYYVFLCSQP